MILVHVVLYEVFFDLYFFVLEDGATALSVQECVM